MASLNLTMVDPSATSFARWCADLVEQLASYNPPNPVEEGSWVSWAVQIVALPEVFELGGPDPRAFEDWRGWASALLQTLD